MYIPYQTRPLSSCVLRCIGSIGCSFVAEDCTCSSRSDEVLDFSRIVTMSSWVEKQLSSHRLQLVATAILSGVAVTGLIFGSQAIRRQVVIDELKETIPNMDEEHDAEKVYLKPSALCSGSSTS